jgi:rhodanese-related sulfurtransferase
MRVLRLTCVVLLTTVSALAQHAPGRIEIGEFRKLHAAKKVLVVDVRDDQSFAAGHIPGAINIPLGDEEQAIHFNRLKAEKRPIVTYCA